MQASGDLLDDRYRLDEHIGGGGMGDVWRATDTVLGRGVAVKLLAARRAGDPQFRTRFRHEARAMAALHHPGVADVYDYGETGDGEQAYLVMNHVDGQPLDERIAVAGRLGTAETMAVVAQAARALHAAHTAGIIHRDVKPGNLIVCPDGSVVLVDFGVASSTESAGLTGVDEVVGTALYIAPEQVAKRPIGPATDIYALGAVAYQCLAGRPPFPGTNPVTIAMHHLNDQPPPLPADVPAPARHLVATAMAKDPAARFPTAEAMAESAETVAGNGSGSSAGPVADARTVAHSGSPAAGRHDAFAVPTQERASRRSRRRAAAVWATALAALAVLGVVLALWLPTAGEPDPTPPGPDQAPSGSAGDPGGGGSPQTTSTGTPGSPGGTPAPPGGPGGGGGTPPGTGTNPPGTGTTAPGTGTTAPDTGTTPPTGGTVSAPAAGSGSAAASGG
jgi:serine/threonine-protein kinase